MKKISERKRIVVKVGTSTLTHKTGRLNIRRVEQLVKTLADLYNAGHEVILVSSGAIGLGMGTVSYTHLVHLTFGNGMRYCLFLVEQFCYNTI